MQHTDKAIAEFEAWWQQQLGHSRFEDVKDQMRNVWVASRAELTIELPPLFRGITPECQANNNAVQKCRAAIEAAGIPTRNEE